MKVTVRLLEEKDIPQFCEWEVATENNGFDPSIAQYPSLRTLVSEIDGEPALYTPFHPVLVVESLGHRPGITPRHNAIAIYRADQVIEKIAQSYKMAEVWWMCSDESLIKAAQARGYEVVKTKVLRKKVSPNV